MEPGDVIGGKYRLVRLLGEGAMGAVWASVNETTQRAFALKLIAERHFATSGYAERMMREARASGRISHRNVVEVYDVGQTDKGQPFLVMQLLSGESLAELLARQQRLKAALAAAIVMDVARGLAAAHAAGVIHRDLKPANVFLHRDGDTVVVKVLDFGVSKMLDPGEASATTTGVAVGSPGYMSPEQARGAKDIDQRTDVWALGVLLFELLSGALPFQGDTVYDVVGQILYSEIPRLSQRVPDIDPRLSKLVASCMARDSAARPASAEELIRALEPFGRGLLGGEAFPELAAIARDEKAAFLADTVQYDGREIARASGDIVPTIAASIAGTLSAKISTPNAEVASTRRYRTLALALGALTVVAFGLAFGFRAELTPKIGALAQARAIALGRARFEGVVIAKPTSSAVALEPTNGGPTPADSRPIGRPRQKSSGSSRQNNDRGAAKPATPNATGLTLPATPD